VSKRGLAAALVLVSAGLVTPPALSAARTEKKLKPKALYEALLKTPASAVLPGSYETVQIGIISPSATPKRHHVVGEVGIVATKTGTAGARIIYIVFPTRAEAMADWKEGSRELPRPRVPPPTVVPKPAAMFNVPETVKDSGGTPVTYGTTTLAYVTGNLIIEVDTSSTSTTAHGDIVGAIALAQFAFTRLGSIEGHVAPAAPVAPAGPIA
jgi:hypothetical protein